MSVRPIEFLTEFPVFCAWLQRRGAPVLPQEAFMSAQGFVAEEEGKLLAASWLYVVPGTQGGIGIIEFTTTNPAISTGKALLSGVKQLYSHLEQKAWEQGCGSLLSFVAPGSGEQHIFEKTGWANVTGGRPHLTYGKARPCL